MLDFMESLTLMERWRKIYEFWVKHISSGATIWLCNRIRTACKKEAHKNIINIVPVLKPKVSLNELKLQIKVNGTNENSINILKKQERHKNYLATFGSKYR